MVRSFEKIILRLFPELKGQYHLPRFGRVVGVSDAPSNGAFCDEFRPHYAVDVELLDEQGVPEKKTPIFKSVPLPVPMAGDEGGLFGYPENGAWVVINFAYGLPHKPFISQVLPHQQSLPSFEYGDKVWAQSDDALQRVDKSGNWERSTYAGINDNSESRNIKSHSNNEEYGNAYKTVRQHCTQLVKGVKRITALGALRLISGGTANLSALDNLNLTTGADLNVVVERDVKETVGGDRESLVKGSETGSIETDRNITIIGKDTTEANEIATTTAGNHKDISGATREVEAQIIKLKANVSLLLEAPSINFLAPTIAMGPGGSGPDAINIIKDLIDIVEDIAQTTATHTHANNGSAAPSSSSAHNTQASATNALGGQISTLMP